MILIKADTIAEAWLKGCKHILGTPEWIDTTMILHIDKPSLVRHQDKHVAGKLDTFLAAHEQYSNHTVAETIFPGYEFVRRGVEGVYKTYPNETYPTIAKLPEVKKWGTYAHRILRRTDSAGKTYNPLAKCIEKMQDKSRKKAAYELGFGFGFDLATYDDDEDRAERMGLPCLSHLSFKLIREQVHLTAMYRSHYYIHRAYGNLLGLARLQAFVASQVPKAQPGWLVCHSTMGRLEYGFKGFPWSKADIRELIATCDYLMVTEETKAAT